VSTPLTSSHCKLRPNTEGFLRVNKPSAAATAAAAAAAAAAATANTVSVEADSTANANTRDRSSSSSGPLLGRLKKTIVKKFLRSKSRKHKAQQKAAAARQGASSTVRTKEDEADAGLLGVVSEDTLPAATPATDGSDLILVGSVNIPLDEYEPNQRLQVKLDLVGGAAPVQLEMMVEASTARQNVQDAYRRCHGLLLDKVARCEFGGSEGGWLSKRASPPPTLAATPAQPDGGIVTGMGPAVDAAVAFHADMVRLSPLQRAVDFFTATMGAHAEEGVSCVQISNAFVPVAAALQEGGTNGTTDYTDDLNEDETAALIAALETAVTSCLFRGARPLQCFAPGDEAEAVVRCLVFGMLRCCSRML
jgi:hypothetical protein